MTQTVKGFKLTSGEEIICELRSFDQTNIQIENPVLIEWQFNDNGAMSYDILPWSYAAKLSHSIPLSPFSVAAGPYNVRSEIISTYRTVVNQLIEKEESNQIEKNYARTILQPRRVSKRKG